MENTTKIGIIGCGDVSSAYIKGCREFTGLDIVACASRSIETATARAEEYNISKVYTVEQLLDDPEIQIVINLTPPKAHAEVSISCINSGKNVYSEKPLAITLDEGKELMLLSKEKGVRLGVAPDTFLGSSLQTARKLIDDGWIGEPIAATAFMASHGWEHWHPKPEFFYQTGGGPMMDMGPYYLTALVFLLGPIIRVASSNKTSFHEREISSQPQLGKIIEVTTHTHITGVMDFASKAICTLLTSFDIWATQLPHLEIYGTEGSMSLPKPSTYWGNLGFQRANTGTWNEIPSIYKYAPKDFRRGIGVADMAYAMKTDKKHRASAELAYHILEVMNAFLVSSETGHHINISSSCDRPKPLSINYSSSENFS